MGNLLSKFVRPEEVEPIRDTLQLSKEEKQRFFRGHRSETQIVTMEAMFCPVSWFRTDDSTDRSSTKDNRKNSAKYTAKSSRMVDSTNASTSSSVAPSADSTPVFTLAQLRSALASCSTESSTVSTSAARATDNSVRPKDAVRRPHRRSSSSD